MGDFQTTKSPPKRVVAKEQAQTIGRGRPSAQANRPMLSMRLAPMCWKSGRASGKGWQLGSMQCCARCLGCRVRSDYSAAMASITARATASLGCTVLCVPLRALFFHRPGLQQRLPN